VEDVTDGPIGGSLSYIENGIYENLSMSVGELAARACFSKTHYQRLFRAAVGEPVMEYIKRRRLQEAGEALRRTDETVLAIALKHGYDSHDGFTRAFKAYYAATPSEFRKTGGHIKKEAIMDRGKTDGVIRRAKNIGETFTAFQTACAGLADDMKQAADTAGVQGQTLGIIAGELRALAAGAGKLTEKIDGIRAGDHTVADVSDTAYALIKDAEDVVFKTHLLCFISGIEILRTGRPDFKIFIGAFEALAEKLMDGDASVRNLVNDLSNAIRAELKRESAVKIAEAASMLKKCAETGADIAEEAKTAAQSVGYGRGYMRIHMETAKRAAAAAEAAAIFTRLADDIEKMDAPDHKPAAAILNKMGEAAFFTNLNAFNAAVETARSGGRADWAACTAKIMDYPQLLHKTYADCASILREYETLAALMDAKNPTETTRQKLNKCLEDILFQNEFMNIQLALETERANAAGFRALSVKFEDALAEFAAAIVWDDTDKDAKTISKYWEKLETFIRNCRAEIGAMGASGVCFAFIIDEYAAFAERIQQAAKYV